MRLLGGWRGGQWGPALACCSISSLAMTVQAEPASRAPVWHAPPECPQAAAFIAQVERLLGQTLEAARDQSLEISGEVEVSEARGYVARLSVRSAGGTQQRELSHRDCAELTEAAALVTALAIDPQLVQSENARSASAADAKPDDNADAPPAPPPTRLVAPPVAAATPPQDLAPRPSTQRPFRFDLAAVGLVGSSVLPRIGVGVGGRARIARKRFGLALQADYWVARFQSVSVAGGSGAGMNLGAWDVGVKACGAPLLGNLTLSLCVGPLVGDMHGSGNQLLMNPHTEHRRWSALAAELNLATATTSLVSTWLGIEVGKTLASPSFGVSEDGRPVEVFAANGWVVSGLAGIGVFQ